MVTSYGSTYHHGDARAALTRAALDLARAGGPRTVTLRAAARDVGVTATAVYRHFANVEELLDAAKGRALALLAERLDAAPRNGPNTAAGARVHAVAEGYLAFARECPGLFGMACHGGLDPVRELVADRIGARRPGVGLAVWSAAHCVAILAVEGSLSGVSEDEQLACLAQAIDLVLAGAGGT